MAMSMKKIGAIAVGGAMVASALATGAFAAEKVGDVDAFAADVVADGNANVDIVVGSNAAALDVVSAANIAAKIGSLMFTEGTVEDGAATVSVSAEAESDDYQVFDGTNNVGSLPATFVASADKDYNALFDAEVTLTNYQSLGKLDTLVEVDDVDPSEWYNDEEDNAAELVYAVVGAGGDEGEYDINDSDVAYLSVVTNDTIEDGFVKLQPGMRLPFLGEEYVLVKVDSDDDFVVMGKEVFDGVIKEGESYDLGNGYTVKVDSVLSPLGDDSDPKVNIKIMKDGKTVAEKFDTTQIKMVYGDIGVVVNSAWENVGSDYGYAELVIVDNVVKADLGEEFLPDWELYLFNSAASDLDDIFEDDASKSGLVASGVALKYVGDDEEDLEGGDDFDIADYITFELEDDDDETNVLFKMDQAKEVSLAIGQSVNVLNAEIKLSEIDAEAKEAVVMTAPIAVLDSEASLDAADKGLILVGGPVVNALTAELADAGLVAIDNESPATLAVAAGAANGNDVLVVAGGDRAATEEAAEALIAML
ncbi:S-layer protein (TIGR01564 family) [Methanococcus maripaludis]|uniref:S-layer protein (TIGR01564 family) n=1 Tax=Methanococcus maripaludis TaxID=39152 RepID=A0A7J9P4T4_METMI|nr:S-layer protein [Methanococcus maripaludis]MBA2853086.1 S-layer protein (TIGR01564 family) [Methanococcus maripaludis]